MGCLASKNPESTQFTNIHRNINVDQIVDVDDSIETVKESLSIAPIVVDTTFVSFPFQGFSSTDEVEPCTDQCECTHPHLNKWDGRYHCMDCGYVLNDTSEAMEANAVRIAFEGESEKNTPVDVVAEDQSVGSMSAARGVKIGFLLAFTRFYNCYNWNSWELIRKILKPATQERRCRVVELPEMADFVGPAKTFISYAQAGTWGDLVAAIADGGADLNRCVWIDLFAIRQWPSDKPDLDFASTIEHCSSFMVVCSYLKEVDDLDADEVDDGEASIYDLDMSVKRQICFARVWCLVEAHKACTMPDTPFIMKVGRHALRADGSLEFKSAPQNMLEVLYFNVDVMKAEATVESDRQRIIDDINAGVGVDKLNSTIRDAIGAATDIKNSAIQCAACGDADAIASVLADPNSIVEISAGGFGKLLKTLLESGIVTDIDKGDEQDYTALILASTRGHESCVRVLLEAGADIEALADEGDTALTFAASKGHASIVQVLVNAGADVEAADFEGERSLMYASSGGYESCVRALLEAGADKDAKDENGVTALIKASKGGHESCVRALLEAGADKDAKDENGVTALIKASINGHESCVRALLEAGADKDAKDKDAETALILASMEGHESCAQALLDAGADKDAKSNDGVTALMIASENDHESCVQMLVKAGADMSGSTRAEFMKAAKNGDMCRVKELLENGVDIETKGGYGKTALMNASSEGHESCVQALLDAGADIEAKENEGMTALIYASDKGHDSCVQALLAADADKEAEDNDGCTALIQASLGGHESCVRVLLDAGADIEAKDEEGMTALIGASGNGHDSCVRALLDAGADIEAKDDDGDTALINASTKGHESCVRVLLEAGANKDAKGNNGDTALTWATERGHEAVVTLLSDWK